MIRPFRAEQQRYGEPSNMADSQFDHPFQWGSKRTGPDLAREGSKYPNVWHYQHLTDPRAISPGSNMPPYPWLATSRLDLGRTQEKIRAMRSVGVPYKDSDEEAAVQDARAQGKDIAADLRTAGVSVDADTQMVALIAYLQRLGTAPPQGAPAPSRVSMVP